MFRISFVTSVDFIIERVPDSVFQFCIDSNEQTFDGRTYMNLFTTPHERKTTMVMGIEIGFDFGTV